MAPRADIEGVVGRRDPEVAEEDLGEPVVIACGRGTSSCTRRSSREDGSTPDERGDDQETLHAARL
ncbi:MAG: hypothetical protein ACOX0O_12715 [Candidatus Methanoculleus thermohydrogenotrophicum]